MEVNKLLQIQPLGLAHTRTDACPRACVHVHAHDVPRQTTDLNVLILCEYSQVECIAFRNIGCHAFSCDVRRCRGHHPEWHIIEDAHNLCQVKSDISFVTENGDFQYVSRWDLIICHPPCTYLCRLSSCVDYRTINGRRKFDLRRYWLMREARDFFMMLLESAPANYVAVENPVPKARARLPRPTTYVQPYDFGAPFSKKTCLWLKNLPPLMPTVIRSVIRSFVAVRRRDYRDRSFPEIATAMAEQWTQVIISDYAGK